MKKQFTFLLILFLIFTFLFSAVQFSKRLKYENGHKIYSVAIDVSDISCDRKLLENYKESGVSVGVVRENEGFDEKWLSLLKEAEIVPALMIYPEGEKSKNYAENLRYMVESYGVKYLLLKDIPENNSALFTEDICSIIADNNITLVLCENISQLSNETPEGYEIILKSCGGRVMRCYETLEKSYSRNPDYPSIYYQMQNSLIDRNTEFLLVNQLCDDESFAENAFRTQENISRFTKRAENLGYIKDGIPDLSGYTISKLPFAAMAAISVIMLFVLFMLFSGKKINPYFYILIAAAFGVTFILPDSLLRLYPTAFSALLPSFTFVLCLKLPHKYCFPVAAISLACGNLILSSVLSGADYYMNNLIFRGVIITLIVPVFFAAAIYFYEKRPCFKNFKAKHIVFAVLILAAGAIYLLRSGNSSISEFERTIRDIIVDITAARPRTKEFLIGWPCLMLFMFYGRKKGVLSFVSYIGSALLFASVTNSFCHVFTDALVIYQRSLNGFLFSIPILVIIYLICKKREKSV